jgi:Flp pilus assembly protein TadB
LDNNELYHYGVKGMRWGVIRARRKERSALNSASKATTDKQRSEYLSAAKKHHKQATNIKSAHDKAKAEKKNMRLNRDGSITEVSKSKQASVGKKVVKGLVIGVGATTAVAAVATTVVAGKAISGVNDALTDMRNNWNFDI